MLRNTGHTLALGILPTLALCQTAFAAEQRSCAAEIAIFDGGVNQPSSLRAIVAVAGDAARVRVTGSGEWSATRSRTSGSADTVIFQTATTIETMTIGSGGEMLWEIDYADRAAAGNRVIAFVGQCGPWRTQ
jgi:hypothetical protein